MSERRLTAAPSVLGPGFEPRAQSQQARSPAGKTPRRRPPPAWRRASGCVRWGGGQTSCPALEPFPAGAGRRGLWTEFRTDRQPASCPGQKGELRGEPGYSRSERWFPRGREPVQAPQGLGPSLRPKKTGKPPTLGTLPISGGPRSGRCETPRLRPFSTRGFGAGVSVLLLGFGCWGMGTRAF